MNVYLLLIAIAALPVIVSAILYTAYANDRLSISYRSKQIIAGFVFGFLAILGTEFGVDVGGAIVNARDSAPLCAGLIFGPLPGIIAGVIGGVERWFCVYWGGGYYTRVACSIATIMAGFLSAALRRYLYDDKVLKTGPSVMIAMTMEVIHMLMIFITNISDVKTAFTYVQICIMPMVLVNTLAVALAVYLINKINGEFIIRIKISERSLNSRFQNVIVVVAIIIYGGVSLLGNYMQKQIAEEDNTQVMRLNLIDVARDVTDRCDDTMLRINRRIAETIENEPGIDLKELAEKNNIYVIDVIDGIGIITASSNDENIGFDMRSGEQSREFMVLLEEDGPDEVIQSLRPTAKRENLSLKYSGVRISKGFVQIAYDGQQLNDEISSVLQNVAVNRRIGENGSILILDAADRIVSMTRDSIFETENIKSDDFVFAPEDDQENTVYEGTIKGEPYYYMELFDPGFSA